MEKDKLISKYYKIYEDLINYAYYLTDYGWNGSIEIAWSSEDVYDAIKILKKKKILILGGDVCLIDNGKIKYTYDNWYTDDVNEEIDKVYKKTIEYINIFTNKRKQYLFILVFDYKKYLDLHRDDENVLYIH